MIRNKLESLKASKFASFKVGGLITDIGPVGGGAPPVYKTQTKDGKLYDVDKWVVGHTHCHTDNFTHGPNGDVFYWDGEFWRQLKGKGNC